MPKGPCDCGAQPIPDNATKVFFFMDGDQWAAVHSDFRNIQDSPVGYGYTLVDAFKALMGDRGDELDSRTQFNRSINLACARAYHNSKAHGFWNAPDTDGVLFKLSRIALMHSELSECLEGVRKDLPDDHLPNRSMEVAELADVLIRAFDYAGAYNLPLGEVILEKMKYNEGRPFMHGDKKA